MSESMTFRKTPEGQWEPCDPPTEEQRRSMDEQVARMFTPDGQFRMVIEAREACAKGLFKPDVGFVEKEPS